ncbi:DUF2909 domain-containing protein [uncultured Shewanella sp.]|uniref:DUF2909 domain-containing protein n=1 Tax=uncultured Shewanella sp. TaxID=173975 RepID=UPI00261518A3|nr:DUF2909 domain-containing protein [uncultured Shewanella sp.]
MDLLLLFKLCLVLLLLFMIFNLGRAWYVMVKGKKSATMSRFLGRRVAFALIVMALLVFASLSGLINPNLRPY